MSALTRTRDLSHFVRHLDGGVARMELEVEGLPADGSQAIEGGLAAIPDITLARVNALGGRVEVEWRDGRIDPGYFIHRLSELGYEAHPRDPGAAPGRPPALTELFKGLAVAAVAALAIRLLPLLLAADGFADWLAAAVAVPAAVYACRPLVLPALRAAAAGRLSRELPLAVAVLVVLALAMARLLAHTGPAAFDEALILVVLVLAVCTLELAVEHRSPLPAGFLATSESATVSKFVSDTEVAEVPAASLRPGDVILVRPGERIAVDGIVDEGRSEVDESQVTGETLPVCAARDSLVHAGTLNGSGTLRLRVGVAAAGPDATSAGGRERSAAATGRAERLYPALALMAAAVTLVARMLVSGADLAAAATAAAAVLIVTYPAAFGLARSAVGAWAAQALRDAGVLLKSPDSIERLAGVDTILFDKTGTLTDPQPALVNAADLPHERLALAGRLALSSRHPLAAVLVRATGATSPICAVEEPGQGVRCTLDGVELRLGRPSFCDAERRAEAVLETDPEASVIAFAHGDERHVLAVRQRLRSDAIETVASLRKAGFAVEVVSGDRTPAVAHAASILGIGRWHAGMTPADKIERICALQARGHRVLMVGDGRNDAPSLEAADAALSVGTAGPLILAAADGVFAAERLAPVRAALMIARRARALRRQSLVVATFLMALAAAPAAVLAVGPLVAALAITAASVVAVLNAARAGVTAVDPAPA